MESTQLFQCAFGDAAANDDIARLVSSLRGVRSKARDLTSRIVTALPGLSIHDISHSDALWEVASTVAGPDYPLNAPEAYVFGAAPSFMTLDFVSRLTPAVETPCGTPLSGVMLAVA